MKKRGIWIIFWVFLVILIANINALSSFTRGDVNEDKNVNIADAIYILQFLFSNGPAPGCFDATDVNDDGRINIADAIYLLQYLFGGGAKPPEPFNTQGIDPTQDTFNCILDSKGLIVWAEKEFGNYDLFGCIIDRYGKGCDTYDNKIRMTKSKNDQYFPFNKEKVIVWQESHDGYLDIYRCDLEKSSIEVCEIEKIAVTKNEFNMEPTTNGKIIAWRDDSGLFACYLEKNGKSGGCLETDTKIKIREVNNYPIENSIVTEDFVFWKEGVSIFAVSNNIIYNGAIPKTEDIILVASAENNRFPVDYSNNIVVFDYGNSIYHRYMQPPVGKNNNPIEIQNKIKLSSGPQIFYLKTLEYGERHYIVYKDATPGTNAIYVYVVETNKKYKYNGEIYSPHGKILYGDGKLLYKGIDNFANNVIVLAELKDIESNPAFVEVI